MAFDRLKRLNFRGPDLTPKKTDICSARVNTWDSRKCALQFILEMHARLERLEAAFVQRQQVLHLRASPDPYRPTHGRSGPVGGRPLSKSGRKHKAPAAHKARTPSQFVAHRVLDACGI